ncbi:hypothetical protein OG585_42910 [Streptomyces sp. NBC_01340]|nr:hypothetical protein OG585_42910 [Streptomyces sp. NBC_01340]
MWSADREQMVWTGFRLVIFAAGRAAAWLRQVVSVPLHDFQPVTDASMMAISGPWARWVRDRPKKLDGLLCGVRSRFFECFPSKA